MPYKNSRFYLGQEENQYIKQDIKFAKVLETLVIKEKETNMLKGNIEKVIFNNPATIVFWKDGTKTVVKVCNEKFDPEKGLAMAIAKKALDNEGNYFNEFKKWLPEESKDINNPDNNLSKLAENIKQLGKNMSSTIDKL